jgi:alkanesulfonate monooxygenase SsuD/methylene tetrahydromethanopterin reductase-like flavin-dependent oxidoreductase (luciferase family)
MKFALYLPIAGEFSDVRVLAELAREAEQSGWDGFFIWDHLALSLEGDKPWELADPWIALAVIATSTERIRIGAMITPLARRRPAKLARETVTLDRLSGGRLTLGVGLGAALSHDFEPFGEETDPRVRAEKLDEGLAVLAGLWSGERFSFEGKHYRVRGSTFIPRPIQSPRIPIWVGGWWPARPPARRAARWDGMFPVSAGWPEELLTPDDYREIRVFIAEQRKSDRPFDLVVTTALDGARPPAEPEIIAAYADAGVTWWLQESDSVAGARERIKAGPPAA